MLPRILMLQGLSWLSLCCTVSTAIFVQSHGAKEIVEIKGKHLLMQFKRKMDAAQEWCKARKIGFRVKSKY